MPLKDKNILGFLLPFFLTPWCSGDQVTSSMPVDPDFLSDPWHVHNRAKSQETEIPVFSSPKIFIMFKLFTEYFYHTDKKNE